MKDKWEQIFEDDDETVIWRYDIKKNTAGPYEVEIKSKIPISKLQPIKKVTRTKKEKLI